MRFFLFILVAFSTFGCVDAEVVFAADSTLPSPSTFVLHTAEPTYPTLTAATATPTSEPASPPTTAPTVTPLSLPTATPTSTPTASLTLLPTATPLPTAITWGDGIAPSRVIPAVSVNWSPYEDRLLYTICGIIDGNTVEGNREGRLWIYDAVSADTDEVKFHGADGAVCDKLGVDTTWGHERNAILFESYSGFLQKPATGRQFAF